MQRSSSPRRRTRLLPRRMLSYQSLRLQTILETMRPYLPPSPLVQYLPLPAFVHADQLVQLNVTVPQNALQVFAELYASGNGNEEFWVGALTSGLKSKPHIRWLSVLQYSQRVC